MPISDVFVSLMSMVAILVMAMEMLDKIWHLDGIAAQVRQLFAGIILGEVGAYPNLGMFSDPNVCAYVWYWCGGAIGLGAGIISCWTFTLEVVKAILEFIKIRPVVKKEEPSPREG